MVWGAGGHGTNSLSSLVCSQEWGSTALHPKTSAENIEFSRGGIRQKALRVLCFLSGTSRLEFFFCVLSLGSSLLAFAWAEALNPKPEPSVHELYCLFGSFPHPVSVLKGALITPITHCGNS